jgi:hypothetical protein
MKRGHRRQESQEEKKSTHGLSREFSVIIFMFNDRFQVLSRLEYKLVVYRLAALQALMNTIHMSMFFFDNNFFFFKTRLCTDLVQSLNSKV